MFVGMECVLGLNAYLKILNEGVGSGITLKLLTPNEPRDIRRALALATLGPLLPKGVGGWRRG